MDLDERHTKENSRERSRGVLVQLLPGVPNPDCAKNKKKRMLQIPDQHRV